VGQAPQPPALSQTGVGLLSLAGALSSWATFFFLLPCEVGFVPVAALQKEAHRRMNICYSLNSTIKDFFRSQTLTNLLG
jgi:hypothetical protein